MTDLGAGTFELQMDNTTPHKVNNKGTSVLTVMRRHPRVTLVDQPPQSPDLNPLDLGIFDVLANYVESVDPQTKNDLVIAVKDAWRSLKKDTIVAMINRMTNKIAEKIIQQQGGNRYRE